MRGLTANSAASLLLAPKAAAKLKERSALASHGGGCCIDVVEVAIKKVILGGGWLCVLVVWGLCYLDDWSMARFDARLRTYILELLSRNLNIF